MTWISFSYKVYFKMNYFAIYLKKNKQSSRFSFILIFDQVLQNEYWLLIYVKYFHRKQNVIWIAIKAILVTLKERFIWTRNKVGFCWNWIISLFSAMRRCNILFLFIILIISPMSAARLSGLTVLLLLIDLAICYYIVVPV